MTNYKQKCLDIYYASDVVDKTLSFGCEVNVGDRKYVLDSDITIEKCEGEIRKADNYHVLKNNYNDLRLDLTTTPWGIVGHPPTLASWLRLMGNLDYRHHYHMYLDGTVAKFRQGLVQDDVLFSFNLTTEEPTDWEALYNIIK